MLFEKYYIVVEKKRLMLNIDRINNNWLKTSFKKNHEEFVNYITVFRQTLYENVVFVIFYCVI